MPLEVVALLSSDCTGDVARRTRRLEVIRDVASLRRALQDSAWYGRPAGDGTRLPEIDFERYVVIAAHAGLQPRCGNAISISAACEAPAGVRVEVTTTTGPAGDDALSWPYAFARVPRRDKPYLFVERQVDGPSRR